MAPGTKGLCDSQFVLDFGLYLFAQQLDPALIPGTQVDLQVWYRDPPAPGSANLTNAMSLTLTP
jgi:hypothetical protein